MKLAVVTDSSAYLPERIKNHPDLFRDSNPFDYGWENL